MKEEVLTFTRGHVYMSGSMTGSRIGSLQSFHRLSPRGLGRVEGREDGMWEGLWVVSRKPGRIQR